MGQRATGRPRQFLIASLTSARLASLVLMVPGCGNEGARDAVRLPPPSGTQPPARLDEADLAALRETERARLAEELRPEVMAELRRTLTPEVRAQLAAELHAASPTTPPGDAARSDVTTNPGGTEAPRETSAPSPSPAADEDIWSTPGTRIWPSGGGLKLVEHVVGAALEDKLPADIKLHYATTPEILYCYSVFENPLPDTTVTHVWRRGSRLVSRVELEVGRSPKWRTWSKQRAQPHWTGLWSCEVLGPDGRQLGLTVFQIGG